MAVRLQDQPAGLPNLYFSPYATMPFEPRDFLLWSLWKRKSLSHVQLFVTPSTIQSMEFYRPEYWSGQPLTSPGDLPRPGIKPRSPALQADSLPAEPPELWLQLKLKQPFHVWTRLWLFLKQTEPLSPYIPSQPPTSPFPFSSSSFPRRSKDSLFISP